MDCVVKGKRWWILLAVATLLGCSDEGDEVARKSSPSNRADAIVLETSQGATTSYTYRICVVPTGSMCSKEQVVAVLYDAVRNESAYGVNLLWVGDKQLKIQYYTAGSAVLQRKFVDIGGRIDLAFLSGVLDENAKPGAMIRNR